LRDVLDEDQLDSVLTRAAGRTEEEVKRLVAALWPRPAVPDLLRRLPERPSAPASGAPVAPTTTTLPMPPIAPPAPPPRGRVEPLSATQHVLRATVSEEFVRDLAAVRAALSHKLPGASLEALLHECMRVTLGVCEKRRCGAGRPAPEPAANDNTGSRYIPVAVRAAVMDRDGGRCAFVAADGHRCDSSHQVQFHHIVPFARGGAATVDTIALRCAAHNRYEAERDFGADHVEAAIQRARDGRRENARQGSLF
jgi:hypothetical protein